MLTAGQIGEMEKLFQKRGFNDYRWIEGKSVVVGQWVRMKCMYGCRSFAKRSCCPPNVPSVEECRNFFNEYEKVAVFHFQKAVKAADERHTWGRAVNSSLLELEREIFLSGYYRAFLLYMDACRICDECAGIKSECKNPMKSRPGVDAMAVDVFKTVRSLGYPIEVLSEQTQLMNRYAFLLVE